MSNVIEFPGEMTRTPEGFIRVSDALKYIMETTSAEDLPYVCVVFGMSLAEAGVTIDQLFTEGEDG